jgi:hypothetical protein
MSQLSSQSNTHSPRACWHYPITAKTNWAQHSFPTVPAHPVPLDSLSPGHPGASPTFLEEPIPLVFSLWNGTIMQEGTQSTLVEPTYPKTGVYNSKIACQTQINGSAQRVPKLPANGLHDYGHIALFKFTAGSPESCDLRPNGWLQLSMAPWSSMPSLTWHLGS